MYEDNRYSRLFFSQNNVGYYGQLAFRLPLNTTLRTDFSYTRENQTGGGGGPPSVNFGGTAADPRNGQNLAYLLFTNQTGATNPATGAKLYSKFAVIDNGLPNWTNIYDGYAGMENWENRPQPTILTFPPTRSGRSGCRPTSPSTTTGSTTSLGRAA